MKFTNAVSSFCAASEDVTDELTHTAGSVITKVAPLAATFASGLSVLFATYDGLGRLLDGRVPAPYVISGTVGTIVMLGLEGASLAAVFNQDRTKAANASRPADQQLPESSLPVWMLLLTMLIVFCLETAPVFANWANDLVATSDLVFAFGLLALPLLGRAGAVIFSNSAVLDTIDGANERRQQRKTERLQAELDLEIRRAEVKQRLAQQAAEHAQRLEIEREKADKKLGKSREISHNLPAVGGENVGEKPHNFTTPDELSAARSERASARKAKFFHLVERGDLSVDEIAGTLDVSSRTVKNYIAELRSVGHDISVNGVVKLAT